MSDFSEGLVERYVRAGAGFAARLREVRPGQWNAATPCPDWDVRQLVNHMTRGNLGYLGLLRGGAGADFLRLREADALGGDPVGAYQRSVGDCAEAFSAPGALDRVLDYPLGEVTGRQALAVRTADSVVHTWDLARAVGADDRLDGELVDWIRRFLDDIYAGLAETPVSAGPATTHRFFAAPDGRGPGPGASAQDLLLHRMGRRPWPATGRITPSR
ncbi:TIGR03086 family metal-binding protein [Phaeacidiphilus oryzae]|uniref:TIGR03086 family metal-binding protein n=1 Tax=Phaeacidiphilus oryzae TaxID=348818 RepID=UPI000560FD15|nr:TIGR03086 family metal-binding protein [Phaeacidiphilus oryzae]